MKESEISVTRNSYKAGYRDGYKAALSEMVRLKDAISDLACEQAITNRFLEEYLPRHQDDGK